MLKTTYFGVDNPKRSHIDPILRKYIWVDSQKKKYIKEKNQFKQVTKYKGQYVVKKQKAGSASQKGGVKLVNECNVANNVGKTFFYKTEFNHTGDEKYIVYFIYYTEGLSIASHKGDYYKRCLSVFDEEADIIDNLPNITNTTTHHILKKKAGYFSKDKYKMYSVSENIALDILTTIYSTNTPILKIAIYNNNNSLRKELYKTFYINFDTVKSDKLNSITSQDVNNNSIEKLKKDMDILIKQDIDRKDKEAYEKAFLKINFAETDENAAKIIEAGAKNATEELHKAKEKARQATEEEKKATEEEKKASQAYAQALSKLNNAYDIGDQDAIKTAQEQEIAKKTAKEEVVARAQEATKKAEEAQASANTAKEYAEAQAKAAQNEAAKKAARSELNKVLRTLRSATVPNTSRRDKEINQQQKSSSVQRDALQQENMVHKVRKELTNKLILFNNRIESSMVEIKKLNANNQIYTETISRKIESMRGIIEKITRFIDIKEFDRDNIIDIFILLKRFNEEIDTKLTIKSTDDDNIKTLLNSLNLAITTFGRDIADINNTIAELNDLLETPVQAGGYKQIPKNKKSVLNKFIKSLMLIGNVDNRKKAAKTVKPAKVVAKVVVKPAKAAKVSKAPKVSPRDKKVAKK
jgi:chemotaxis protein histidine kinase CheA